MNLSTSGRLRTAATATARRRATRTRGARLGSAPGPVIASRPHIVLLGSSRAARRIERALERDGVAVRRTESPERSEAAVSEDTRALWVVPPIPDVSVAQHCAVFGELHPRVPVFAALHGRLSRPRERTLQDSGVGAIFRWPGDRKALLRTAARLTGAGPGSVRSKREGRDIALEELANGRLSSSPVGLGKSLVARVRHGCALLSGAVDALWKVRMAEQLVAAVPGIDDVIGDGAAVRTRPRS